MDNIVPPMEQSSHGDAAIRARGDESLNRWIQSVPPSVSGFSGDEGGHHGHQGAGAISRRADAPWPRMLEAIAARCSGAGSFDAKGGIAGVSAASRAARPPGSSTAGNGARLLMREAQWADREGSVLGRGERDPDY